VKKSYDIVAAFTDADRAEAARIDLERRGLPKRHLHLVRPTSPDPVRVSEMEAEMQDEVSEGFAGPGVGFMTPSQAKGAAFGTTAGMIAGLVIGAAVGAVWAFAMTSAVPPAGRLVIAAVAFALGGAIAGAVTGGSLKPRAVAARRPGRMMDERRLAGETDTLLEVHVDDDREAAIAQEVLEHSGAERVDSIDDLGAPLPPQSEHPRPADPPGYWKNDGHKRG